jgi:IMP dehydrogenase
LCAAAISPFDSHRANELDRHVDILVIDVAHFHNVRVSEATKKIMKDVKAEIVVGNIGTFKAAEEAITKLDNVAAFRVGIGSGSICSTTTVTRAGAPTLFATCEVADAVRVHKAGIPIIADGGIRGAGDIAVALAAGASAVMIGNLFARCKEAPGTLLTIGGRHYMQYRGMASPSARAKRYAIDRYSTPAKGLPEGVEGWVPYKGEAATVLQELVAGLQAAMGYAGAASIRELWKKATFLMISQYGEEEARPHDILLPSIGCSSGTSILVDTGAVHYGELTVKGAFHHTPSCVEKAINLISTGGVKTEPLISRVMPLEEVSKALDLVATGQALKIAIRPARSCMSSICTRRCSSRSCQKRAPRR